MRGGHLVERDVSQSINGVSSVCSADKVKNQLSALRGEGRVGGDVVAKRKKLCSVI